MLAQNELAGVSYGDETIADKAGTELVSHQVYKFEPGRCTCVMGDPVAGSMRIDVLKISGTEAVLESSADLREDQYVYTTVELEEGPSLSLSGLVVSAAASGILVQWEHNSPREADRVDLILRTYEQQLAQTGEGGDPEGSTAEESPGVSGENSAADPADARSRQRVEAPPVGSKKSPKSAKVSSSAAKNSGKTRKVANSSREPTVDKKGGAGEKRKITPTPISRRPKRRITESSRIRERRRGPPRGSSRKSEKNITEPTPEQKDRIAGIPQKPERIVLKGGKVDLSASILRRAKRVSSSELAARLDTVRVLNISTIKDLIKEAVNEAAKFLGATIGDDQRRTLLEEAEESFRERLQAFQAEKAGLEEQTKHLEEQLGRAQGLLKEEQRKVVSAHQFTVSDAGMVELEQRLGRLIDRALHAGNVDSELEEEMRKVVLKLLDDERNKIRDQAQQAQSDKIALLEKKIGRLAHSLDSAEEERDRARRHAAALEASGGTPLRNVMTAGLDDEDPDKARKLDLLKEIFDFNKQVREELESAGHVLRKRVVKREKTDTGGRNAGPRDGGETGDASGSLDDVALVDSADKLSVHSREKATPDSVSEDSSPKDSGEEEDDTVMVMVKSPGEDVDPDDLPWEAPESSSSKSGPGKIRRLGK